MSTETQILETLQKLNKVLDTMSKTTSSSPRAGGSKTSQDIIASRKTLKTSSDAIVATATHVTKLGDKAQASASSLHQLAKSAYNGKLSLDTFESKLTTSTASVVNVFNELSKTQLGTSAKALNDAIAGAATSISAIKFNAISSDKVEVALSEATESFTTSALGNFTKLDDVLKQVTSSLTGTANNIKSQMTSQLGVAGLKVKMDMLARSVSGPDGKTGLNQQVARATGYFREFNKAIISAVRGTREGGGGGGRGSGGGGGRDHDDGSPMDRHKKDKEQQSMVAGILDDAFVKPFHRMGEQVADSIVRIIDQALQTTGARGFGGILSSSFYELSFDAAMAGMSLEDYTKDVLAANEGILSRSSSFDEFNDRLSSSAKGFEQFGIYGEEGMKLAATIAQTSSSLGVPMSDLEDSTSAQVKVFDALRKTTGITAEEFTNLIASLKDNEIVQRELLALSPKERTARIAQISEISQWGRSLGMSESAARQLSDALLAQRKATVKERFQARGRLNQAMSLAGMDAGQIAEASSLISKKVRTTEEDQRLTTILGEYKQRQEQAIQFGGPAMQYQFETMDEKLREAGNLGNLLDAAGNVKMSQESGPQIQKDINQKFGALEKHFANFVTILGGLSQSPLFAAGAGFLAIMATSQVWKVGLATAIGSAVATALRPLMPSASPLMPGAPEADGPDAAKTAGKGGRLASMGKSAMDFLKSPLGLGFIASVASLGLDLIGSKMDEGPAKAMVSVLSDTASFAGLGAAIGSIIPGIGTAIGAGVGALAGVFKGLWTNWGTLFGSNDEALEKNTEETKKNNEIIKARRDSAPPSVIATSDLSSAPSNVLRTARAYDPTIRNEATGETITMATPAQQSPKNIKQPETVNKEQPTETVTKTKSEQTQQTIQDSTAVLTQILEVLKQSLGAESQQVELASQLLRSMSTSRVQSKEALMDRATR